MTPVLSRAGPGAPIYWRITFSDVALSSKAVTFSKVAGN